MKQIMFLIINIFISALVAYFVSSNQSNLRFIIEPRSDNQDYGYFQVDGKRYYQAYTTTQVNIGNGLHYHRIDLRSNK
ncbi:MAG: hypothetical protein AAB706_04385 [Patescibacteria group bacterium]